MANDDLAQVHLRINMDAADAEELSDLTLRLQEELSDLDIEEATTNQDRG